MLPFVTETFYLIASPARNKPPKPDALFYGQKEIGGPIATQKTTETFTWVYYNQTITKTFQEWYDYGGAGAYPADPVHVAHYSGKITFQTWVEALSPYGIKPPILHNPRADRPVIVLDDEKKKLIATMRKLVQDDVGADAGTNVFTISPIVTMDQFRVHARTFISNNTQVPSLALTRVQRVEQLIRGYNKDFAAIEKQKHEIDEQNKQNGYMRIEDNEEKLNYDLTVKHEAAIRATIRKYFRELLDTPYEYHYT